MTHKLTHRQRLAYAKLKEQGFFSRISKGQPAEFLRAMASRAGSAPKKRHRKQQVRAVAMYTLGGELVKAFPSINAAVDETHISQSNIRHVADGRRKSAGGYGWRYVEEGSTV